MFNELTAAMSSSIVRTVNHINQNPGCDAAAVKGSIPLKDKNLIMVMMTPAIYEQFKKMMEQDHVTFHAYLRTWAPAVNFQDPM